MRVLVDMNLSPRWVTTLVDGGFLAAHWSSIGPPDAADTIIMDHARLHAFVVLTHDLDFGAILAATNWRSPSVVQIRADNNNPEAIGAVVMTALWQIEGELNSGVLATIEPGRLRLRILPLR